jgi:hypothetical protein
MNPYRPWRVALFAGTVAVMVAVAAAAVVAVILAILGG